MSIIYCAGIENSCGLWIELLTYDDGTQRRVSGHHLKQAEDGLYYCEHHSPAGWRMSKLEAPGGYLDQLKELGWTARWISHGSFKIAHKELDYYWFLHSDERHDDDWQMAIKNIREGINVWHGDGGVRPFSYDPSTWVRCAAVNSRGQQCDNVAKDGLDVCRVHRPRTPKEDRVTGEGTSCSVEGCEKEVKSKGMCMSHYGKWYREEKKKNERPVR